MVDNRSAGFFGIGGSFNFKSGDISGTAAKMQDDKMGQGGEYFAQQKKEEEEQSEGHERYMDRSDTFGYSKLDNMPEEEGFSIAKILAEIIHSIQSLFTQK